MTDDMQRARESFEKWHCEKFKTQWLTGAPTRDMHNGVYDDKYGPPAQQERWELWQAAYAAALRAAPELIRIPAADGLDPITLYVEDAGNGSGRLTIICYADAWTCYWGSMGCGLTKFVAKVDASYLLGSMLWPNLGSTSKKTQAYIKRIAQRVIDQLAARPQGVKDA